MYSKIREYIKLDTQPVAVIKSNQAPEQALRFKDSSTGCMIGMLTAASKGKTAVFTEHTTGCNGARAGLGFAPMNPDFSGFLSIGTPEHPGLCYKKTDTLARAYAESMPKTTPAPYLVFKPLNELHQDDDPLSVVFLVNPDQLSALITLAHYDRTGEQVKALFGSGCASPFSSPSVTVSRAAISAPSVSSTPLPATAWKRISCPSPSPTIGSWRWKKLWTAVS